MSGRNEYQYSVNQCQVNDKAACEQYRVKRRQWLDWLNGDDPHSITRQIYSVIWDYALFCTVNEIRRIAIEEPEKGVGFNGSVLRMFDAGFATTQATAIRRLIEWPSQRPDRAVISLRSILNDIRDNIDLITRENYVCYDGLPYDYETVRDKSFSMVSGPSSGVMPLSGPEGWPMSERMHKNFDKLAGINPENKSRKDIIREEVFDYLETQIKPCEKVKKYVDKFIAHGAAPETRESLTSDERGLTLEKIESSHKIIYRVASFINSQLLWESNLGGVPVPQYDHLKGLDMRWTSEDGLRKAQDKWQRIADEIEKWETTALWPPRFN